MKKFFKILIWTLVSLILLVVIAGSLFIYKVKSGFPVSYETDIPAIQFPSDKRKVLLFSKATGFRHTESIETGIKIFSELGEKNNWFLYLTEQGGVFNSIQLAEFDVVVFNNCTGRLLNEDQKKAFEEYISGGGSFIGIHGAGDDSHHWDWYTRNLIGANFSHHSMDLNYAATGINLNAAGDSLMTDGLPSSWSHGDEWYVFFENPKSNGFQGLYSIDGEKIPYNGNILFVKDKNFGMGKEHPVAWYGTVGKGKTFYTSLGHSATAWNHPAFKKMLENAVNY